MATVTGYTKAKMDAIAADAVAELEPALAQEVEDRVNAVAWVSEPLDVIVGPSTASDDTALLQQAFLDAAQGGIARLTPREIYRVHGTLAHAGSRIVIDGGGGGYSPGAVIRQFSGLPLIESGTDTSVTRTNGAITAGSGTLTGSAFIAGDVGKYVDILGADTSGGILAARITAYTNATTVTVAPVAVTTVGPTATYTLNPYDAPAYNGSEGLSLRNLTLQTTGGVTALGNGQGNYLAGSHAIKDWRGGDIHLDHVAVEGFEFGLWGIQSDLDTMDVARFIKNKTGAYLGPRSDQLVTKACEFIFNDRALDVDSAWGHTHLSTRFTDNGAAGINPIRIRSTYSRSSAGHDFDKCWFEHLNGVTNLDAFVEIGVSDIVQASGVTFTKPRILTDPFGGSVHMKYLVKLGNCTQVEIDAPQGPYATRLDSLIRTVTTQVSPPEVALHLTGAQNLAAFATPSLASGATVPNVYRTGWKDLDLYGGQGTMGRLTVDATGSGGNLAPGVYSGATVSGPPTVGTYPATALVMDQKGLVWVCVTPGNPGSWVLASIQSQQALVTGRYAFPQPNTGASTSNTLGVGTLRVSQILIPRPVVLSKIGAEITSAGDSGSKLRIGIWADSDGYPSTLVLDAGTINGDSATVQELSISQTLAAGLYWTGGAVQLVTTTEPTVRTINAVAQPTAGTTIPTAGQFVAGFSTSGVTGALSDFPGGAGTAGSVPRIFVKT